MKSALTDKVTIIWLLLASLTGLSWMLGENQTFHSPEALAYMAVGLFALAFFKVRLVIMYFMEVLDAPRVLRGLFEAWVVVIFFAVVSSYLLGVQF